MGRLPAPTSPLNRNIDRSGRVDESMTAATDPDAPTRVALFVAGFAVLWVVLAALRPSTTFHLAPLILPLLPVGLVMSGATLPDRRRSTQATLAAVAVALLVTAALSGTGRLGGPSLLPSGGAATEAVVFTVVAGLVGIGLTFARSR